MKKTLFALCLSFASLHLQAKTQDSPQLSLGFGQFDITRKHSRWMGQIEWKSGYWISGLRAFSSVFMTEKYSTYLASGLAYDIFLGKRFVVTPSFGPGLYIKGKGKDLHYPLEFRSSIEAALRFSNRSRLGIQFFHISNASLGNKNPGSEILTVFYSFPLKKIH